jgi:putative endonuclease
MCIHGYAYLLSNQRNNVVYTGVTSNLQQRIYQHRQRIVTGFTHKYNVHKLVYCEIFDDLYSAIVREKQIKAGSRRKKMDLIQSMNPTCEDLYNGLGA